MLATKLVYIITYRNTSYCCNYSSFSNGNNILTSVENLSTIDASVYCRQLHIVCNMNKACNTDFAIIILLKMPQNMKN